MENAMKKPNFLIVGAPKSGTSSYAAYLAKHPDIYFAPEKECHFFSDYFNMPTHGKPWDGYVRWKRVDTFDEYLARHFRDAADEAAVGEGSTEYLYYHKTAIPKIKQYLGENVKIIIMLRDPRKACFSRYKHSIERRWEKLAFQQALDAWNYRKLSNFIWDFDYIGNFEYATQVKAYQQAFPNVHIILLEEFMENKEAVFKKTLQFLEVDDTFIPDNFGNKYNDSELNSTPWLIQEIHRLVNKHDRILSNYAFRTIYNKSFNLFRAYSARKIPKQTAEDQRRLNEIFIPLMNDMESVTGITTKYWMH